MSRQNAELTSSTYTMCWLMPCSRTDRTTGVFARKPLRLIER